MIEREKGNGGEGGGEVERVEEKKKWRTNAKTRIHAAIAASVTPEMLLVLPVLLLLLVCVRSPRPGDPNRERPSEPVSNSGSRKLSDSLFETGFPALRRSTAKRCTPVTIDLPREPLSLSLSLSHAVSLYLRYVFFLARQRDIVDTPLHDKIRDLARSKDLRQLPTPRVSTRARLESRGSERAICQPKHLVLLSFIVPFLPRFASLWLIGELIAKSWILVIVWSF